jgi:hypothetical protein
MPNVVFIDDSEQTTPYREGMGPLTALGYVHVKSEEVADLETELNELCTETGFPEGEEGEFKWSPGSDLWMRDELIEEEREQFFLSVLRTAWRHDTTVGVVVEDTEHDPATEAGDPLIDLTRLLIERIDWRLRDEEGGRSGLLIADRPSGGRSQETDYLERCLQTVLEGTAYVDAERIALNVVSTPSHLIRGLQLADLVVSATLQYVAGEEEYAPPIFKAIRHMLASDQLRTGGIGLKIHPDYQYANLYHWLLDDSRLWRNNVGHALPREDFPYSDDPTVY